MKTSLRQLIDCVFVFLWNYKNFINIYTLRLHYWYFEYLCSFANPIHGIVSYYSKVLSRVSQKVFSQYICLISQNRLHTEIYQMSWKKILTFEQTVSKKTTRMWAKNFSSQSTYYISYAIIQDLRRKLLILSYIRVSRAGGGRRLSIK